MGTEKKFGKHSFEVSNLDKIFFPKEKYSKGDLIDYYEKIADHILPHLKYRPLTMVRYPNGIDDKRFFQKDAPDYFPEWIQTESIEKKEGGRTEYVICNDKASLVYLANQACITPHIWLSRIDNLHKPDRLVFDLDPSKDDFKQVKTAAKQIKKFLEEKLDLPVFVMTTGSRGLHLTIPIKRTKDFDEVRDFAQEVAKTLESEHPETLTTEVRKNKRGDKIFLDVARNAFAQTAVTPYAVRPLDSAPVATPLEWKEVTASLTPKSYTIKNIFQRLGSKGDPWEKIDDHAVNLSASIKKMNTISKS